MEAEAQTLRRYAVGARWACAQQDTDPRMGRINRRFKLLIEVTTVMRKCRCCATRLASGTHRQASRQRLLRGPSPAISGTPLIPQLRWVSPNDGIAPDVEAGPPRSKNRRNRSSPQDDSNPLNLFSSRQRLELLAVLIARYPFTGKLEIKCAASAGITVKTE